MMRRRGSASVGGTANEDCTKPRHTQSFVVLSALSSHSAVSLCIVVALLTRQFPLTDVRLELNRERHASKLFSPSLTSTSNLPTYDISSKSVKIKSGESNINAEDEWRLKQLLPMIVNESSNKVDLLTDSFSHMAVNDGIVIRPLLTSAPPRPSIWSPITSTVDSSVEGDLEFVGMVWWHELDAERSCNIAACSRAEQFEPDFLVLDEKSKRERYLSTDTQLFDYLAESHKENVHSLEEHCKDDTATALFGCNVEGACAVRKCESFEAPSRFAGHHNLFNSTFDVSEGPVLHNVSLAEAALFNAANETETAIRSILVSRSPDRLVSGCGSASPLRWTSLEDNCHVPDGDYTSTSVVELLEEPEPESWFPDSGIFGAATNLRIERMFFESLELQRALPNGTSVETNSLWDRSQRRPICMSPQFRLPYESGILSSKSNIGSLRCSYSSGSIHREERSLSEATVTSARLPPHLVGSLSPSQHESDRASRRQHHSSRSSANSDRIERIESEVRGPGRRSRDEELARQYALPVSAAQIASMPLSELNRMMQSAHLTQTQQNLVRKIRRRGKNKLAARTCRKRRNDKHIMLA